MDLYPRPGSARPGRRFLCDTSTELHGLLFTNTYFTPSKIVQRVPYVARLLRLWDRAPRCWPSFPASKMPRAIKPTRLAASDVISDGLFQKYRSSNSCAGFPSTTRRVDSGRAHSRPSRHYFSSRRLIAFSQLPLSTRPTYVAAIFPLRSIR